MVLNLVVNVGVVAVLSAAGFWCCFDFFIGIVSAMCYLLTIIEG